jgi:hypothetical protein
VKHVDPALISTYSVERFIPALFGRIEVDADGKVTAGQATLGYWICVAGIDDNPAEVDAQFDGLEAAVHARERADEQAWRREYREELADHQQFVADLAYGPERVFDRANLNGRQRDVLRLFLEGIGLREIGRRMGVNESVVRFHRTSALSAIKGSAEREAWAS